MAVGDAIKNTQWNNFQFQFLKKLSHIDVHAFSTGGSNGSEYLDSVECYDPSKLKWVPATKLPSPRFSTAAIVLSKRDNIAPRGP